MAALTPLEFFFSLGLSISLLDSSSPDACHSAQTDRLSVLFYILTGEIRCFGRLKWLQILENGRKRTWTAIWGRRYMYIYKEEGFEI